MARVDLIYAADCPNVPLARANLLLAFARTGVRPQWSEHRIDDPDAAPHTRGYGSPTILVEGRDVVGLAPSAETCCRVYEGIAGLARAPAAEQIASALASTLQAATSPPGVAGWRSSLATVPGIGLAFLPKIACPACWPAYAGLLTSGGLAFLLDARWLFPLTAVFLLLAVFALSFRARRRRGFGPFFVSLNAAAIVLTGKFGFANDLAMYAGLGLLVAASIWNTWPNTAIRACSACIKPSRKSRNVIAKRQVEVFSAGCGACQQTINIINEVACSSCEITVHDMHDAAIAKRANDLGIRSVPAVVINGKLADCCAGRGADVATLRAAGLGQS
jgi:mercuric ion transport protein